MAAPGVLTKTEALRRIREDPQAALTLDIPDDMLLELQKELDPYARIVGAPFNEKDTQAVALSITNLREDYMRRFMMTGLIGFNFRMLREWEVPIEQRRWTPGKPKGELKPYTVEDLENRIKAMQTTAEMLKQAEEAAKQTAEIAERFKEDKLVFSEEDMKMAADAAAGTEEGKKSKIYALIKEYQALKKKADEAQGTACGLKFAATVQLRNYGIDSDMRLPQTVKQARKHSNASKIIDEHPGWDRGILPMGQLEMPADRARGIIQNFLSNLYEFNPDAHVRKAYDEVIQGQRSVSGLDAPVPYDPVDPERIPPSVLLDKPPASSAPGDAEHLRAVFDSQSEDERRRNCSTLCRLLQTPRLAKAARYMLDAPADDPDRLERWRRLLLPDIAADLVRVVPPQDTFHRFKYYLDVNFEGLRSAVCSLYQDKPGLDFAIQLMEYFKGPSKRVLEDARRFRDEHQENVIADIKVVSFGGWTVLGEFTENRETIDVNNDQAALLGRILKRFDEDNRFGKLLMKQRMRAAKAKNIAEEGPDDPGLSGYKSVVGTVAPAGLSPEERLRLERANGNLEAARQLEHFEQKESIVKNLEAQAKLRELTPGEEDTLRRTLKEMDDIREMMEVPKDAIQVDVWNVDAGKQTVSKSKIYTRAVAPGGAPEDLELSRANDQRDEMIARIAAAGEQLPPASYYPAASQELARKAFAEGKQGPDLAPFAQDFLGNILKEESKALDIQLAGASAGADIAAAPAAASISNPVADADPVQALQKLEGIVAAAADRAAAKAASS